MKTLSACALAASLMLLGVGRAHGQGWVDLPEVSLAGSGRGDDCVRDAATRATAAAWERALADLRLKGTTPLRQCAELKAGAMLEVTLRKKDVKRDGPERCRVPFSVRYRRAAVADALESCVSAAADVPVGVILRAERIGPGDDAPRTDEDLADAAKAGIESWISRASLLPVSLPEYQDAFVRLKTSLGQYTVGAGGTKETVFGSASEARTVLSRWLGTALAEPAADAPELQRWRACGGLMVIGTLRLSHRVDAEKGFADVRGTVQVTYVALSRDLTLIGTDHDDRPQPIFDSNGGYEEAARTLVSRMVGTIGPKLAQKLSTFTHTDGCTAP
ncbi:MAG: hypothetical protein AB7H96_22960 [Vicinamibacterales bacterium]